MYRHIFKLCVAVWLPIFHHFPCYKKKNAKVFFSCIALINSRSLPYELNLLSLPHGWWISSPSFNAPAMRFVHPIKPFLSPLLQTLSITTSPHCDSDPCNKWMFSVSKLLCPLKKYFPTFSTTNLTANWSHIQIYD